MNHSFNIVVLGNCVESWMATAFFSKLYQETNAKITLVINAELSCAEVVSVHPAFKEFLDFLEIREQDFLRLTKGCFKLADVYANWKVQDSYYFHAFGEYGAPHGIVPFHELFLAATKKSKSPGYDQFSLSAEAAKSNLFCHPDNNPASALSAISYTWHFEVNNFIALLKNYCLARGVNVVKGTSLITYHSENPSQAESVYVSTNRENSVLKADFLVDSSAKDVNNKEKKDIDGIIDWGDEIFTDTVIHMAQRGKLRNNLCDIITCLPYGYDVVRPGAETVDTSLYTSSNALDEPNLNDFLRRHNNPDFRKYRHIPFRKYCFWQSNRLYLGEAAISLPSHAISNIDLAWQALKPLLKLTPDIYSNPYSENTYNNLLGQIYDHIKDFVRLQFCVSDRNHESFWGNYTCAKISNPLEHKLTLFRERAVLPEYENELFDKSFCTSFLMGTGFLPKRLSRFASVLSDEETSRHLYRIKTGITQCLSSLQKHEDYLATYTVK